MVYTHIHMHTKRRHIPAIKEDHWKAFNTIRQKHEATWQEVFERFYNYQDLTEHFFKLPKEVDRTAKMNAVTVQYYLPMWLENMYRNFIKEYVKDIRDIKEVESIVAKGTPGLVIASGPSLFKYKHTDLLAKSKFYTEKQGIIIATSHSLIPCLESGVVPDYVTITDAEDVMLEHIDHPIVDEYSSDIMGIFSTHIHPDVLDRWNGDRIFVLTSIPDMTIPNVQGVISGLFPNLTEFNAGAHVGAFSWNIAHFMGCDPIAMIGLDCAFDIATPIEQTPYYSAYRPSYKTEQEMIDECYHFHTHSFFGNNCYTDDIHYGFMEISVALAKLANEHTGVKTINCTGGGFIDEPDIIENMHFADWLKQFED